MAHKLASSLVDVDLKEAELVSRLQNLDTRNNRRKPASPFSNKPYLSSDVIDIILEYSHPRPKSSLDISDFYIDTSEWHMKAYFYSFTSYALISRIWLGPARRYLYRIIPTRVTTSASRLSAFCSTIKNVPAVRPLVRRLHVHITDHNCSMLVDIVKLLPNCGVCITSCFGLWKKRLATKVARWENISGLGIKECLISDAQLWDEAFRRWTRLSELHLSGHGLLGLPYWSGGHQSTPGAFPSLRRLVLSRIGACAGIPSTSANTLHTFIVLQSQIFDTFPLLNLIQHHSESLRRIYIKGLIFQSGTHPQAPILEQIGKHTRNLEYIHIRHSRSLSRAFLTYLPRSIVEVCVDVEPGFGPSACTEFLHGHWTALFMPLKKFYISASSDGSSFEDWNYVLELAKKMGVDFGVTMRASSYWEPNLFLIGSTDPGAPAWSDFVPLD
jgi:hypothetical protein